MYSKQYPNLQISSKTRASALIFYFPPIDQKPSAFVNSFLWKIKIFHLVVLFDPMAQAARLNLRMQKELKLLITDPPPGATFPSLSSLSSVVSLSSIDARKFHCFILDFLPFFFFFFWCIYFYVAIFSFWWITEIKGPEGSVYEKGIFKLKIQIPERYFSLSTF